MHKVARKRLEAHRYISRNKKQATKIIYSLEKFVSNEITEESNPKFFFSK